MRHWVPRPKISTSKGSKPPLSHFSSFCVSSPHQFPHTPSHRPQSYYLSQFSKNPVSEMESTGYRHRRSPSSDRFLGVFSFAPPSSADASAAGEDELNEAEFFWTTDFAEPSHSDDHRHHHRRLDFQQAPASGILAAISDADGHRPFLYQKPSISFTSSSSKAVPMFPRPPERECPQPVQCRNQSAPMKVPVLTEAVAKRRKGLLADAYDDEDDGGDDQMLPPHELVSRGSGVSPKTTFSVLEGVGRTLKGRDLRQVRNAIWRKTGFLD
jgi:hypothetical protein